MSFDPWEPPPSIAVDGIPRVLHWLRCFLNYSPEELAGYAGLRADVLERFEAGYHALPVHDLLRLSKVVHAHVHVKCIQIRQQRRRNAVRWLDHSRRASLAWKTRSQREALKPRTPEERRALATERTRQWRQRQREAMAIQASGCSPGL